MQVFGQVIQVLWASAASPVQRAEWNMRAETRARRTGGTHSALGIIVIVYFMVIK